MNHMTGFIAHRATLVSKRSVGAVEHRIYHAFTGLKDHPDTSIAHRAMSACEPTFLGLKDHPDTSIAHRAMSACEPTFLGLKDRRIICMVETSTPPSIGLSDLMFNLFRFIALRATLVSKRSVGAS